MNNLDYIIIGIMAVFIIKGIFLGLFREMGLLSGIIGGIWLGNRIPPVIAERLPDALQGGTASAAIFCTVFVLVLVLCLCIGLGLHILLARFLSDLINRLAGACLGAAAGLAAVNLMVITIFFYMPSLYDLYTGSRLAPFAVRGYQVMSKAAAPAVKKIEEKGDELQKQASEAVMAPDQKDQKTEGDKTGKEPVEKEPEQEKDSRMEKGKGY